jgi:hypothetical protein
LAAAGDVDGLTVALSPGAAGWPLAVEAPPAESLLAATFSFPPFCTYHKSMATPPASKSNAQKTSNANFRLDPVFANTSPNAGAAPSDVDTLLFDLGVTISLNFEVIIDTGVTTSGAAAIEG